VRALRLTLKEQRYRRGFGAKVAKETRIVFHGAASGMFKKALPEMNGVGLGS
jgi:hypothetical protein